MYQIGNTNLEHVNFIRDLGVTLDSKLTFGLHLDITVKKANKALGFLVRSFQKANKGGHLRRSTVLVSYYTHVRSIMEYCSVIWGGAAAVHTSRLDRIQPKFLLWLNAHTRNQSQCLSYDHLLAHYGLVSMSARRTHHNIVFTRSIFSGRIRSSFLLSSFSLNVPARSTRQQVLLHVPYARVSTVKEGLFVRLPRSVNSFLSQCPNVDFFCTTFCSFRALVKSYVSTLKKIIIPRKLFTPLKLHFSNVCTPLI